MSLVILPCRAALPCLACLVLAVSLYMGGTATLNMGPNFAFPPPADVLQSLHLSPPQPIICLQPPQVHSPYLLLVLFAREVVTCQCACACKFLRVFVCISARLYLPRHSALLLPMRGLSQVPEPDLPSDVTATHGVDDGIKAPDKDKGAAFGVAAADAPGANTGAAGAPGSGLFPARTPTHLTQESLVKQAATSSLCTSVAPTPFPVATAAAASACRVTPQAPLEHPPQGAACGGAPCAGSMCEVGVESAAATEAGARAACADATLGAAGEPRCGAEMAGGQEGGEGLGSAMPEAKAAQGARMAEDPLANELARADPDAAGGGAGETGDSEMREA